MPGLKVIVRDGVCYATGTVAGQRVRKSLGTRDRSQAEELCAQYEARLWKRHSYGEEAVRTFGEAAAEYLDAGGDATYLPPIVARFRGRVLGSIKPEEIRQAARTLYPDHKASSRNRNTIVPARAVINFAAGLGWCAPIRVKSFPIEKPRRFATDRDWLERFVERADGDGVPHLAAAMMFMWQTGARVSEAAGVLPEHVDLAGRQVMLASTKTEDWVPCRITRELMIRLANLGMTEGQPVFGYASRFGIYRRMRAVCRRAQLPWRPPHQAGRHSYATNALARGATVPEVMEGGRWKSSRLVLETYAHADEGASRIADLFDDEAGSNLAQPPAAKAGKQGVSRRSG